MRLIQSLLFSSQRYEDARGDARWNNNILLRDMESDARGAECGSITSKKFAESSATMPDGSPCQIPPGCKLQANPFSLGNGRYGSFLY